MGSLDKAMNETEYLAWIKTAKGSLTASYKMDGGSVSLEYADGKLTQAVTRGDGFEGEDITDNVLQFKGVPKKGVKIDGKPFTGFIRGEIMLLVEDWKVVEPDMVSNPRNVGNGISRRKDGEQADLLTIYTFRAHNPDGSLIANSEWEMLTQLQEAGFQVAPFTRGYEREIWHFYEGTLNQRAALPYWIDGVVVKIDGIDAQVEMGETDQRPKGQVAIKFPALAVKTTLREVELTVGHTGAIIPTGRFDPVQLGGTTVTNALLCNWDIIRGLDIAINDEVMIYKAGEIIPRVEKVVKRPANRVEIPQPIKCPVCGGKVGRKQSVGGEDSVALYCLSEDCPAQVMGKIDRYIKSLNILGIGDEVLAALIDEDLVLDIADLYVLHDYVDELAELPMGAKGVRLGEKRAVKILDEIDKKRELTLAELLGSLGIDGLGKRRVALIQNAVPGQMDLVSDWTGGKLEELAAEAGVPGIGQQLSDAVMRKTDLIEALLLNGVTIKSAVKTSVSQNAKSFCFTGASSVPRKELQALVVEKGHVVKSDVGKGLDYLVMADPESTSSKAVKARKLGTKCISEETFRGLMEGET
jgi:DNA ligase (NAD+)